MDMRFILLASALAATISTGASAATLSVLPDAPSGPNDFQAQLYAAFGAGNLGFGILQGVTAADTGESFDFAKWGSESGFTNTFTATNGTDTDSLTETGNEPWACRTPPGSSCSHDLRFSMEFTGALDKHAWTFTPSNTRRGRAAEIGDFGMGLYYDITGRANFAFLSYDDIPRGDDNHDDFLVRVSAHDLTVTTVPLPAAAWLFLTAMGGFAMFSRKKTRS